MSSTGRNSLFDESPDKAYFKAIERLFIELRGAPFQLSPDDFDVAKEWRGSGIPLDLALGTLREVIERRIASDQELQRRLRYYQRAVRAAWKTQQRLTAPAAHEEASALDIAGRLASLEAALPRWPALSSTREALKAVDRAAEADAVEAVLADVDELMLEESEASLEGPGRRQLDAGVAGALEILVQRLPKTEIEAAEQRVRVQILRQLLTLPILSLFSPDALRGESSS